MSNNNFADTYKSAGLTPSPEIITLRQKSFSRISENLDFEKVIEISRLYFGVAETEGKDWFKDSIREDDPSFSMIENEREVNVIAGCLLKKCIEDGDVFSALSILTLSAAGNRNPLVLPELIEEARMSLILMARDSRESMKVDFNGSPAAKISLVGVIDDLVATPEWPKMGEILKKFQKGINVGINNSNAMAEKLSKGFDQVDKLKEEVNMLWWHIGGWSEILSKPFLEIEPGLAAVVAGIELSDLSHSFEGPASASAILYRTLNTGSGEGSKKYSIKDVVNKFPPEFLETLALDEKARKFTDVCPILGALFLYQEAGAESGWESAFKKLSGISATCKFEKIDLAAQVFRERSLLAGS